MVYALIFFGGVVTGFLLLFILAAIVNINQRKEHDDNGNK
jgi:hypothetical protein